MSEETNCTHDCSTCGADLFEPNRAAELDRGDEQVQ